VLPQPSRTEDDASCARRPRAHHGTPRFPANHGPTRPLWAAAASRSHSHGGAGMRAAAVPVGRPTQASGACRRTAHTVVRKVPSRATDFRAVADRACT
jgi:hypothetical protein